MATVEFGLGDLNSLLGQKLPQEQVQEACAMLGMPLERTEGDTMVLEVNPNRPDWLSVEGIARSLSSFLSIRTGMRKYSFREPATTALVDKSFLAAGRPYCAAAIARNVTLSDELLRAMMQLQEKLCETLGRRRTKVSIGTYDLSRLSPPFYYKGFAPDALSFVPLEMGEKLSLREILERHPKGRLYAHILDGISTYPVITDSKGEVLALIPITNGESSKLVAGAASDVFIEANGTSRNAVEDSIAILCAQLADRGAAIEQIEFKGAVNVVTPCSKERRVRVSAEAVRKLLGIETSCEQIASSLGRMGFDAKVAEAGVVAATVPLYRSDIMHEADLIEDVGIAYGYQNFSGREPPFATIGAKHQVEAFADRLRQLMAGLGFQDCITFTLTNENVHYARMLLQPSQRVQIGNPLTTETTMVRTSILPGLLSVLEANKDQKYPQRLSEVGDVVLIDSQSPQGCSTKKKLCAVVAGKTASLSEIKSVVEALLKELEFPYGLSPRDFPFFVGTRCAAVQGDKVEGFFGEIHPQVLEGFNIEMPVAAFELWFD